MTIRKYNKDLLDFPYAFEVDRSWYQSYWYDSPSPAPASSGVNIAVWFAVLAVGVFAVL